VRSSTIVLVACLIAIAGFALADALRDENDAGPAVAESEPTTTEQLERTLPPDLLTGRLVFIDGNCGLAVIELTRAVIVRIPDVETNCALSAPVRVPRLAYGVGEIQVGPVSYRVTDFSRPERVLGRLRARPGSLRWAPDGGRLAWCNPAGRGAELRLGRRVRPLPGCALAYTQGGEPVYGVGNRLVAGKRDQLPRTAGRITAAAFGADRSIAIALDGARIRVYRPGSDVVETPIPRRVRGVTPIFAPDNCGAIFLTPHRGQPPRVLLIDLGCLGGRERDVSGRKAAWSPDGRWFAVAEERTIAFSRVDASRPVLRLPGTANQLVWQR